MPRPIGPQVVPALARFCNEQSASGMHPHILTRNLLNCRIQRNRVCLQARNAGIAVISVKSAGSVPAGARSQFLALAEYDVAPTKLGEVVQHTAADDTSADHDHSRVRFHGGLA